MTTTTTITPVKFALALATGLGWKVIACKETPGPDQKRPYDGLGVAHGTNDPEDIATRFGAHPNAHVGVATGPSGLICADFDRRGTKDGFASTAEAGLVLPPSHQHESLSGNGLHVVYRDPAGIREAGVSAAGDYLGPWDEYRGMSGFDVLRGNSYFIMPVSAGVPTWDEIALAPASLLEPLPERPKHDGFTGSIGAWLDSTADGETDGAAAGIVSKLAGVDFDYPTMRNTVAALVDIGAEGRPIRDALVRLRAEYLRGAYNTPEFASKFDTALDGAIRQWGAPRPPLTGIFAATSAQAPASATITATEAPSPERPAPVTLDAAHTVMRRWLGDEYDIGAYNAVLAAAAVEQLDGDPLWLLTISGSGNAKTETVQALDGIGAHIVSTITSEGALLSATSNKERAKNATGGLLRKIGQRGVLVIKDVTSILSMDRTARGQVLAALREIYDGRWSRQVGTDGGKTLSWDGRLVVIGAVTTAWDQAHAVIASMGDRFVLIRMDSTTGRQAAGRRAIGNTGHEVEMRADIAAAAAGVLANVDPARAITPTEAEADRLLAAADLVTLARTGVEYDYRGDVIDAHAPEMPTRFAKQLAQVMRGAVAIGMDRSDALKLAIRCARDSMPPLRLEIVDDLAAHPGSLVRDVRKRIGKPRATVDRQLQALHMLGVAEVDEEEGQHRGQEVTLWRYRLAAGIDPDALNPSNPVPEMLLTPHNHTRREGETETETEAVPLPSNIPGTESGTPDGAFPCPLHSTPVVSGACAECLAGVTA